MCHKKEHMFPDRMIYEFDVLRRSAVCSELFAQNVSLYS